MPVCKAEAHRALELLEDYYSRLDDVDERELKVAIERVIKIFKSRLFQALLDIQEFYELTLMDDGKTNEAKASVAIEMASRWVILYTESRQSLSTCIIKKILLSGVISYSHEYNKMV